MINQTRDRAWGAGPATGRWERLQGGDPLEDVTPSTGSAALSWDPPSSGVLGGKKLSGDD